MRVAHSRRFAIALFAVAAASLTFTVSYLAAPSPPIVREEEMRAEITRDAITITTPVTRHGGSFHGTLTVELLDTTGSRMAGGSSAVEMERGEISAAVRIDWPQFADEQDWEERRDLLMWTRVRYRLNANRTRDCSINEVSGVRALGPIVKDLFALRLIAPSQPSQETPAHIRVFAENPFTGAPVSGVRIQAELNPEDMDENDRARRSIPRTGVTRADGGVSWDFTLPPAAVKERRSELEYKLKLAGMRGVVQIEKEQRLEFRRLVNAIITTDKTLYQPGQALHIRTLVFDPGSRHARAAEPVKLQIRDEAYKTVFERDLTTDRFGVAFSDWMIPPTAPLGSYSIQVGLNDGDKVVTSDVRLSRYELPTFVANVEPDQPFYLPGQDAKVKVSARFVYGEPVKSGHIRVARVESRSWNFTEQKWDVSEEGVWEGDSDSEGIFETKIPLKSEHEALAEDKYDRFRDPEYVARYTETASGRGEERRFRLRVSKQAIHVYAISPDGQHADLPMRFFVVANYADGSPARCDLSVLGRVEELGQPKFTTRGRTDEHGIASIEIAPPGYLSDLQIDITARDEKGKSGTFEDVMPVSAGEGLLVKTSRALYHQGEPLRVDIQSSIPNIQRLFVELVADNRIIRTETVKVLDHHASVEFAANGDLSGQVTIVAYDPARSEGETWESNARTVLYPRKRALELKARFDRTSLKPGEAARAAFSSEDPNGRARETSLAVVVYDSAVEERERTESESGQSRNYFGEYYARFYDWHASLSDVTLRELEELDESRPFPTSIELIAEALLQRSGGGYAYRSFAERLGSEDARSAFRDSLNPIRDTIKYILDKQPAGEYPRDAASLSALLARHGVELGIEPARATDMWGNPYYAKFDVISDRYALSILSAGPDEQKGTGDDFDLIEHSKPFFDLAWAKEPKDAVAAFTHRRGRLPRNAAEVILEMMAAKARFLGLKDPWSAPYRLRYEPLTTGPSYEMEVLSAGPDRKFDQGDRKDDVSVARFEWNWFASANESISSALTARFVGTHGYPASEAEFIALLKEAGVDFESLRDPWNQPLKISFVESTRYSVRPRLERVAATPTSPAVNKTTLEPVTQRLRHIDLRASVPKELQKQGYPNEFKVASYSQVISEESRTDALVQRLKPASFSSTPEPELRRKAMAMGLAGAVTGVVTDANGASISAAELSLTNTTSGAVLTTTSDDAGFYAFVGLVPGVYSLRAEVPGFRANVIQSIQVRLSTTVTVNLTMEVGGASELVTVTASAAEVLDTSSAVAGVVRGEGPDQSSAKNWLRRDPSVASTPRLRQEFPETLVWQPSLITDSQGRAEIKFNVADSITTWRMAVIGSTQDGLIGSATADLRAFQPFFVEHQPPPSLTIGDQIETPVVVRNYQDRAADVKVKLASAPWMELLSNSEQSIHADAQGAATALASFKTIAAGDFKQEASAMGGEDGDRVAKPVTVRFDGRDTWRTYADLFQGETSFDVNIPEDAISGSSHLEMKIYPDLFAHALEGIEGIVRRPHGCLEQTTSAGYANLIALQYMKRTGRQLPSVERKAEQNLSEAVARVRSFGHPDGGYFYFGGSPANLALTAYVLRFLTEAREFVTVDPEVIEAARQYLVRGQRADGAWEPARYYGEPTTREETPRLTALIARALSASEIALPGKPLPSGRSQSQGPGNVAPALNRSLDWLAKATREFDDPYALALYVLAARGAGRIDAARESAGTLAKLAMSEDGALFWDLQSNTPFYGWGRAGRLETTGLAVEALNSVVDARRPAVAPPTAGDADSLSRASRLGVLFMIKSKDQYGVWYSTQATVNVLHGLLSVASRGDGDTARLLKLAISVDQEKAVEVDIPADAGTPYEVDLTTLLQQLAIGPGRHRVRVGGGGGRTISAAIVARSSVPWVERDARGISEDGGLRLRVSYDRLDANKGETINCAVHAERVGSAGYGMMLAEIGLPPGVDVDIASLRRAPVMKFDVTPDRIVLYLWPRAGGTDFSFGLTPRLRIRAAAQPSLLYDYYNPDARVSVPPARFSVR